MYDTIYVFIFISGKRAAQAAKAMPEVYQQGNTMSLRRSYYDY